MPSSRPSPPSALRVSLPLLGLAIALAGCAGSGNTGTAVGASQSAGGKGVSPAERTERAGQAKNGGASGASEPGGGAGGEDAGGGAGSAGETATAIEAPAPGVYRYRQSGGAKAGTIDFEVPPEGTLEIHRVQSGRQRQVRTIDERQQTEQVLRFASDGIRLESAEQAGMSCSFDPPLLVAPLPLRVGATWSDEADCKGVAISIEARVERAERVEVGGTRVDTLVVASTRRTTGDGFSMTTTATTWFAPAYGLIVRDEQRGRGSFQETPFTQDLTERLISLSPRR